MSDQTQSASPLAAPLAPLPPPVSTDDVLDRFLDWVASRNLHLYEAQEQAILELFDGRNVILNTPTGSGKSLVAAALHYLSVCQGRRSVYTCPVKALVNEKFLALCRDFGPELVGISTGDATVNPHAPILCCTAEVLANLALRDGDRLQVDDVIMDEFHYYADRERGVAWQVPLLTLPQCRFLLMSATLGDVRFFERELTSRTGRETTTVSAGHRPVPLAFEYVEDPLEMILDRLRDQQRLPAYVVHFTQRSACETAQNLMSLELTSRAERERLGARLAREPFHSPYGKALKKHLRHGIGVHHAGMLPRYRILVEQLAQANLLKVICGTDTLGVGVNIPMRTVLFTALAKYDGERQRVLPARDFHQIAGRAGRKGFDDEGFVVAMAPAHVIENRRMERKGKKFTRARPPEKGYVHWDESTFRKLMDANPEPLTSSFRIHHGMVLNVLARDGDGCAALRQIIRDCHEAPAAKPALRRRTFALFRSLVEKDIVRILPQRAAGGSKVRLNIDLQDDFSLDQALSLYLVDTVEKLDPQQPDYALLVLSLVESVLENPAVILRKQVDRMKDALMAEMKAAGVPFEERLARLEDVEHPKPHREFTYGTFNAFAAAHPWVGSENIQPKSIAREMFERYLGFADYVREYGLERAEGVLLRHLANTCKTVWQSVPAAMRTPELLDVMVYLEQLVRTVDSSILDEWEKLRNPEYQPATTPALAGPPSAPLAAALDPVRDPDNCLRAVRAALFQLIRPLARGDWQEAAEAIAELAGRPAEDAAPTAFRAATDPTAEAAVEPFAWPALTVETVFRPYWDSHTGMRLDPPARAAVNTALERDPLSGDWRVAHTLVDPDEFNDWRILFTFDVEASRTARIPVLHFQGVDH
jgi:superfamily II RNA helicase